MARTTLTTLVLCSAAVLAACGSVSDGGRAPGAAGTADGATAPVTDGAFVNVVKLTGIAWFDRMETGIAAFAADTGIAASQTGPATDSPEQQVGIIQSLIAQDPRVLGIVPSDPGAVEAVIRQAREAGIVVVTHEAPQIEVADADIEAFANDSYGRTIMEDLSQCMGGEGQYVQFVGKLTAETHMEWSRSAAALQQESFPGMTLLGDPVESDDNADTAYERTKQLLQANPELVGFQGASSQDVPGIARAVQEAGLEDETCVFGTGVPSETEEFLRTGAVDAIYLWDPALAGEAVMRAGQLIADGGTLTTGTDLGVEGYDDLQQSPDNPLVFVGDAQLTVTAENVDDYDF
jgi:simple sugar transport system substrate-binding protein